MTQNNPLIWQRYLPKIEAGYNKYDYGHAIIVGGNLFSGSTGAAKLAALAALKSGAGLVSIVSDKETLPIYASSTYSIMVKHAESIADFEKIISDERVNSILIGPGAAVNQKTKEKVLSALKLKKKIILDADAITIFQDNPQELFDMLNENVILTPHEGEFERIFSLGKDRIDSVILAAKLSKANILLKGRDTIIAAPSGEFIINENAPPCLAKAGTGDVLAGIAAGLIAQKVPCFYAGAISCYIHSQAAELIGLGLIAEDLLNKITEVLRKIYKYN